MPLWLLPASPVPPLPGSPPYALRLRTGFIALPVSADEADEGLGVAGGEGLGDGEEGGAEGVGPGPVAVVVGRRHRGAVYRYRLVR